MASGESIRLRYIQPKKDQPFYSAYSVTEHPDPEKRNKAGMLNYHGPHVNPDRDTALSKKARKKGRRGRK